MSPAEDFEEFAGTNFSMREQAREAIDSIAMAVAELGAAGKSREVSLALTKLEEAEMWVKRHIEKNLGE